MSGSTEEVQAKPGPTENDNPYRPSEVVDSPKGLLDGLPEVPAGGIFEIRTFLVIHIIAAASAGLTAILAPYFDPNPVNRPWYYLILGLLALLGVPCMFAGPGRGLFLLYVGAKRDRRLLLIAVLHFLLTGVQVAAIYFRK